MKKFARGRPSLRTLCIVQQGERVLLGRKKRGFGVGKWNGFGGKLAVGESIEDAAKRELMEEAGIVAQDLAPRGILHFSFASGLSPLEVHIFAVTRFLGEPHETEEMAPRWFTAATIPYSEMWADDTYWLPTVLRGESVEGNFHFQDETTLLSHEIKEVAPQGAPWHS